MLAHLSLGISIRSNALLIARPQTTQAPRESATEAVSPPMIGQSLTRQDLLNLPARIPPSEAAGLILSHDLDVRYKDLWHGMLAAPATRALPEEEGFHPGTSPALPRPLLIHPAVRYLRRDVLYFPYLQDGDEQFLLCLAYRGRKHTPFLIGLDGLIVPYVYVSEEDAPIPTFPGDPARICGLTS